MNNTVDAALLRGALEQIRKYCHDTGCPDCQIRHSCVTFLGLSSLDSFAAVAIDEVIHGHKFSDTEKEGEA